MHVFLVFLHITQTPASDQLTFTPGSSSTNTHRNHPLTKHRLSLSPSWWCHYRGGVFSSGCVGFPSFWAPACVMCKQKWIISVTRDGQPTVIIAESLFFCLLRSWIRSGDTSVTLCKIFIASARQLQRNWGCFQNSCFRFYLLQLSKEFVLFYSVFWGIMTPKLPP